MRRQAGQLPVLRIGQLREPFLELRQDPSHQPARRMPNSRQRGRSRQVPRRRRRNRILPGSAAWAESPAVRRAGRIEILPAVAPVRAQRVDASGADRHEPCLVALANHLQLPRRRDLAGGRMYLERVRHARDRLSAMRRPASPINSSSSSAARQRGAAGLDPSLRSARLARVHAHKSNYSARSICSLRARWTGFGPATAAHGLPAR